MIRVSTFLLLLTTLTKGADVYWVSPTGTATWEAAESDTPLNGAACTDLATACANVVAGDTVYLRGGEYDAGIVLQSKNGTLENRITFAAHTGEQPVLKNTSNVIFAGRFHNLFLRASDYIVVQGIDMEVASGSYSFAIEHGSSYNTISNCNVHADGYAVSGIWTGNAGSDPAIYKCEHNWIYDCTFSGHGEINSSGDDIGGFKVGSYMSDAGFGFFEQDSGNNTIESCTFYGGGHHNLETFSKFNIIRNNHFYNADQLPNPNMYSTSYGPDESSAWGNRNIQIYDGKSGDGMWNLLEGNRFGASGPPPDDDGGDGMTITAPANLIRYNTISSAQNNGVYFKVGAGSYSDNNRFYNNTIFGAGRFQNTGPQWQGASFRMAGVFLQRDISTIEGVGGTVTCVLTASTRMVSGNTVTIESTSNYNGNYTVTSVSGDGLTITFSKAGDFAEETSGTARGTGPNIGNVVVNNVMHGHGGSSELALVTQYASYNTFADNWLAADGDPLFISEDETDLTSATLPNLRLQSGSGAIDNGAALTLADGAGSASTTLVVDDAQYFQDGSWGSSLSNIRADWITVGTVGNAVEIAAIDYDTNTITLASPLTWADNDPVWLYRKSDGVRVLYGTAPDKGAFEFAASSGSLIIQGTLTVGP